MLPRTQGTMFEHPGALLITGALLLLAGFGGGLLFSHLVFLPSLVRSLPRCLYEPWYRHFSEQVKPGGAEDRRDEDIVSRK